VTAGERDYATGRADGLREGRALQATLGMPAGERAVFDNGYRAGANGVFSGYDGGWGYAAPYLVVLGRGSDGITYRMVSRTELTAGIDYYLCPDGPGICRSPR
jgi:hypothetical protein